MLASHVGMKSAQVATDQRRPPVLAGIMGRHCKRLPNMLFGN
jgi:hypothetical protein